MRSECGANSCRFAQENVFSKISRKYLFLRSFRLSQRVTMKCVCRPLLRATCLWKVMRVWAFQKLEDRIASDSASASLSRNEDFWNDVLGWSVAFGNDEVMFSLKCTVCYLCAVWFQRTEIWYSVEQLRKVFLGLCSSWTGEIKRTHSRLATFRSLGGE